MSALKHAIANAFSVTGASQLGLRAQALLGRPYVRALNYHDVPRREAAAFERQLDFYAQHFVPVGLEELLALGYGRWPHARPGLLLSFDDGLATHAQVVAPLLEKHGFPGWFMVPTGFVDAPVREQAAYAREHAITPREAPLPDGRLALSWEELRRLAGRHVIGCHTVDHVRFRSELAPAEFLHETVVARERLEAELGETVEVFAWVGGEEASYSRAGAEAIRKAGFRVGLMTNSRVLRAGQNLLQIQRTNVESNYSPALMRLHLSGFYDALYRPKRARVERLTRVT